MKRIVRIPHLNYIVIIIERPKKWPAYASTISCKDWQYCKLILPKGIKAAALSHELIHVLQAICEKYNIDFLTEDEHMAYLMQYLMEKILRGKNTLQ